ncbi:FAD-binding oxidoreductase [Methylobacterium sp. NEAU 140]|uniref:FAD-binding oxidoreductase n=1 Tax=Methylobacterium sp. NEAU 140 TaxID=3064945 RepID=UPI0027360212|nr:FAD-binding oxidoreductase [Methylobacterium sp. NEAU 140]MDP4022294.1 FAD-binding oxidoreductase [Methylobacterium sp. NEAU 140]
MTDAAQTAFLDRLRGLVGASGVVTGEELRGRPASWTRPAEPCAALALVRPRDTAETSAVMAACAEAGVSVVPRGGATGLVDGILCAPDQITLSTERMTGIEPVDPLAMTVVAGTGATVEAVQGAARAAGLFFPLDLGARGSATVGGTISTNAGGLRVLRYGMMREMVLGLEAVLADGTVVSSMRPLIKNNTGLDLKQLFVGTEGTLGLVTRAVLRLRPEPAGYVTALIACPGVDDGARVLRAAQAAFQGRVSSFEGLWPDFYRLMTKPGRETPPLPQDYPFYAIIEVECVPEEAERFHDLLDGLMTAGTVLDAALASSEEQRQAMWRIRDRVEHMNADGIHRAFDVSVPLARMDAYVTGALARLAAIPDCRAVVYGHIGDNNLHWNTTRLDAAGNTAIDAAIYEPLAELNGSVSAEHGIGLEKRGKLGLSRSGAEIAAMRLVKRALDPDNRLNPGKIF